jgi:hypothetical protein
MKNVFADFLKRTVFIVVALSLLNTNVSQAQYQLCLRDIQLPNESLHDGIIRIYLDKFGDYYPDVHVPINKNKFLYLHGIIDDKIIENAALEYYFTNRHDIEPFNSLKQFYYISLPDVDKTYLTIEDAIIAGCAKKINDYAVSLNASRVTFLIHGFNSEDATKDLNALRAVIKDKGYENNNPTVYVEVFYDGLGGLDEHVLAAPKIWAHAQNNTKWISLGLRRLINKLPNSLEVVMITHSMGASVATGALWNTVSKWKPISDVNERNEWHDSLKINPPPILKRVRLGMIAPAIPGQSTFCDFNNRVYSETNQQIISPDLNKIYPIAIAWNPKDFAVSKLAANSQFLSTVFGATTLGCNYGNVEIKSVRETFENTLHYSHDFTTNMVNDFQFTTEKRSGNKQQHGLLFYLKDHDNVDKFLASLYK